MFYFRILKEFTSSNKEKQFNQLKEQLMARYEESSEKCLLVGNFNLNDFNYDAIVLCDSDLFIFEFKSMPSGNLYIHKDGWYDSQNNRVWTGTRNYTTPYEQMRVKRNILFGRTRYTNADFIKVVISFDNLFEVAEDTTYHLKNEWLFISDVSSLKRALEENLAISVRYDQKTWNHILRLLGVQEAQEYFFPGSTKPQKRHKGFLQRLFSYFNAA